MQESVAAYALRPHRADVRIRVGIDFGKVIVPSAASDLRWDVSLHTNAPQHGSIPVLPSGGHP